MEWQEYYRIYQTFDLSMNMARVVAKAADHLLQDFPTRLPEQLQAKLHFGEEIFKGALADLVRSEPGERVRYVTAIVEESSRTLDSYFDDAPGIVEPALDVYLSAVLLGVPRETLLFGEQVYVQQLVMTFAYLDAFIADSVRAICQACPAVLKSRKTLDWATIVSIGNWEGLLQALVDRCVHEFGFRSVVERIDTMRSRFGLELDLGDRLMRVLEVGEMIRNLFVHNGGRVNQDFIDRTATIHLRMDGSTIPGDEWIPAVYFHNREQPDEQAHGLRAGDMVRWDSEMAEGTSGSVRVAAGEIFVAVSTKFFAKKQSELTGVVRQKADGSGLPR